MKKSRNLTLLGIWFAMFSFVGCGSGHSGETYILVTTNVKIPYWQSAAAGFGQAASRLGVGYSFQGPDTYDPAAERDSFEAAIQKKPAGLLVSVADPTTIKDSSDRAIAAGIPVITIASDAPASKRLFFIGTNNYQAGILGGKRLAEELKGKGTAVVFTMPSQPNLDERLRGYKTALEGFPQIKLAHIVDIKGDPRVAFDATTQFLANDKKEHIDAFVCLEALSGKEVADVLDNYNIKGRTIMAMDDDPDTLQLIQKGEIAATISQKPYTMAYMGLLTLDNLHHAPPKTLVGDWAHDGFAPVPAFVDTGSAMVDKSNVDAFLQATKSISQK